MIVAAFCAVHPFSMGALERLEPSEGCYIGFTLGSGEPIGQLSTRLGFAPAVYVKFYDFSGPVVDFEAIRRFLEEVATVQGIAMLTLEPWAGLETVTEKECRQVAEVCAEVERRGIGGIFIRFGHEMNGNWYGWGQRPALFKSRFRLLADSIHAVTTRTAMVWAPNYGVGYPFGTAVPVSGSEDFRALDTNGDGRITDRDDMYEPYYPGNDAVDWVGMTLYHWGIDFPWRENELPVANSFANSLTGTHQGSIPDFYARYCLDPGRNKPMAITETAAFYNTEMTGPAELRIKQAWWSQIFSGATQFPRLKCINWFDERKRESVAENDLIDWRVSADPEIRAAFVSDLRAVGNGTFFLTADKTLRLAPNYISAKSLPEILPVSGAINVVLEVKAEGHCDLVIDLLDKDFHWQGGTRVPVSAPGGTVTASFSLKGPLTDHTSYRWSIFLTPKGGDYLSALAWYHGPNPSDDPDGDGAGNEEESVAGTAPRDSLDVLVLKIERDSFRLAISWESKLDRGYRLFSTTDLKTWNAIGEVVQGTGHRITATASSDLAGRGAIYRLQVVHP